MDISFGVHSEHLLFCAPNKRGQYEVRYASSKSFREGEYIGNGIFTFLVKIIYLSNMTPVINGALRLFALLLVKTTKEAIFRILS